MALLEVVVRFWDFRELNINNGLIFSNDRQLAALPYSVCYMRVVSESHI